MNIIDGRRKKITREHTKNMNTHAIITLLIIITLTGIICMSPIWTWSGLAAMATICMDSWLYVCFAIAEVVFIAERAYVDAVTQFSIAVFGPTVTTATAMWATAMFLAFVATMVLTWTVLITIHVVSLVRMKCPMFWSRMMQWIPTRIVHPHKT
jgi:hypothetical protein